MNLFSGAWGGKIAKYGGLKGLPLLPMKHAYVVSESIPGVRGMPNVRDHDDAFYFRIQGESICMGGYEGNPHMLEKVFSLYKFYEFILVIIFK